MTQWSALKLGLASLSFLLLPSLHAQAVATATKTGTIEAGAGITYLNNDYSPRHNGGVSAWVDGDFFHYFHTTIGVDIQLNFTGIDAPDDIGENSYLVGPAHQPSFLRQVPGLRQDRFWPGHH